MEQSPPGGSQGQLDTWFEHYNSVHPHKALGYRSPREFRKEWVEKTTA
jgi:transposase InsO family protein